MPAIPFAVTTIKMLLAALAIARGGGLEAGLKALADLIENATKLDNLIGDLGLRDLAANLAATADQQAAAFTASRDATPAQIADARALFDLCAPRAIPTPGQFAALGLNPGPTLAHMEEAARQDRDFARNDLSQSLFRAVLTPVLAKLLSDPAFTARIVPALWRQTLADLDTIKDDTSEILILVRELHQVKQTTVHQDTILAIARKIRPKVETREQALIELERAVDKAAEMETAGERGSNVDGFADEILSRLRTLTRQGALDDAVAEANRAIVDCEARVEREQAGFAAVLRAAINQHELAFDAAGAAEKIVRLTLLETPDLLPQIDRLREIWLGFHNRGREHGSILDLQISVQLADLGQVIAQDDANRGKFLANLGFSLGTTFELFGHIPDLIRAIEVLREAECKTEGNPLIQMEIQHRLGNNLRLSGERSRSSEQLGEAVACFRRAIQGRSQLGLDYEWATSMSNLGGALGVLGTINGDSTIVAEGVEAIIASLSIRTRKRNPVDWAHTQHNLGTVVFDLARITKHSAHLIGAGTAFHAALLERTREKTPQYWAQTQNNLGRVLGLLGMIEEEGEYLRQAYEAFHGALTLRLLDISPMPYATTIADIGILQLNWFHLSSDNEHLNLAEQNLLKARAVYQANGTLKYIQEVDDLLAQIAKLRSV